MHELSTDPTYNRGGKQSQIRRLEEEIIARNSTIEQLNTRIKQLENKLSQQQSEHVSEESPKKTRKIKDLEEQLQKVGKEHRTEDKKFLRLLDENTRIIEEK